MICETLWPEAPRHRDGLMRVISKEYEKHPTSHLGVMGQYGWSSPKTFCEWKGLAPTELTRFVGGFISECTGGKINQMVGWANILPWHSVIHPHDHHQADVSAIYYLHPGTGAPLCFPHLSIEIDPRAGMLILFPGLAQHEVRERGVGCDRVSIAFNAVLS